MLASMKMRIKAIREKLGLTQADLAHEAGIRIATLSELENGKANSRLSTLESVAEVLNVGVLDLFVAEGDEPTIFDLAHDISKLDDDTRAAVTTIVLNSLARQR